MGTLIRNKNLESNFLTPGIRFQFKVPHVPVLGINKINQIHKILPISLVFLDYYFTVNFKSLFQNTLKRAVITTNRFFALPALHKDLLLDYKAKTHKLLHLINQASQKIQQNCTNMQLHEKKLAEHSYAGSRHSKPWCFRRSNIVQTSRPRGQHLCSKFAKIPHVGCARTFKVPTLSRGHPPRA